MEPTSKPIAVISGDIVNSTKLTSEQFEQLLQRIKDIQRLITEGNSSNAHSKNATRTKSLLNSLLFA